MAQSYSSSQLGTVYIPGAYPSLQIQAAASGLSTTGVIAIIGEAAQGIDYTLEPDITQNFFGPNQAQAVIAKYGSGPIVDAFINASNPSNDPLITNSPSAILILKTNVSGRAVATLNDANAAFWGQLDAQAPGANGNLIYFNVTSNTAEVLPTTGPFTWINNVGAISYAYNINGGAIATPTAIPANTTPAGLQGIIAALGGGITATGGANRGIITVSGTLTVGTPVGYTIVITRSVPWAATPVIGDTLYIPAGSAISGASNVNNGAYVVTAVTTNSITVTKLSDGGKAGAVVGVITPPAAVGATSIVALTDIQDFAPVVISLTSATLINGVGKSLEFANQVNASTDNFSANAYNLNTTLVSWVSKSGTPVVLASGAETNVSINDNLVSQNVSESATAGGEIALKISYAGTSASVTITTTQITGTVVGGSGAGFGPLLFSQYGTIGNLASYINSLTGWSCSLGTAVLGSLPLTALDDGTFTCNSIWGAQTGRIKDDAYRMYQAIQGTQLLQLNNPASQAVSGLPGVNSTYTYLAGGSKGGTSNAIISNALLALQNCTTNFVVPLFSQDATADITAGVTDPTSTYTISAINAATSSHVNLMSQVKRRRNRQAFLSALNTFTSVQNSAANIANYRCSMFFQSPMTVSAAGNIVQQQPWMSAALAAGLQASAFYRSIVHKYVQISGITQVAGDFSDQNDTQVQTALLAGLDVIRRSQTGGWYFVSDQTTYGASNSFYYNSISAIYNADTIALTTAQRMENQFVGSSTADTSAAVALTYLDGIMADFRRLKLITPSAAAPAGYTNATVTISGTSMAVSLSIQLTGTIYFIPINFLVTQVVSTASQPQTTLS